MISFKKYLKEIWCILNANNIISTYPDMKADKHKVNLIAYHIGKSNLSHYNKDVFYNLGDELGKVVIDWMLERRGKGLSRDMWVKNKKFFLSIGSGILGSYQDVTFWGTGVQRSYSKARLLLHSRLFRKLDIRAVRGPLSRQMLIKLGHKCPEVYGDPAILMPEIFRPDSTQKEYEYAIIPQFAIESKFREEHPNEFYISMNTNDYKDVITKILKCKKIISSSLHGVILAEAYGIPAIWIRGLMKEVDFKYRDWYYSTNRYDFPIATSLNEALSMTPPKLPDLTALQKGLIETFPYDLWEQ